MDQEWAPHIFCHLVQLKLGWLDRVEDVSCWKTCPSNLVGIGVGLSRRNVSDIQGPWLPLHWWIRWMIPVALSAADCGLCKLGVSSPTISRIFNVHHVSCWLEVQETIHAKGGFIILEGKTGSARCVWRKYWGNQVLGSCSSWFVIKICWFYISSPTQRRGCLGHSASIRTSRAHWERKAFFCQVFQSNATKVVCRTNDKDPLQLIESHGMEMENSLFGHKELIPTEASYSEGNSARKKNLKHDLLTSEHIRDLVKLSAVARALGTHAHIFLLG